MSESVHKQKRLVISIYLLEEILPIQSQHTTNGVTCRGSSHPVTVKLIRYDLMITYKNSIVQVDEIIDLKFNEVLQNYRRRFQRAR